MPETRREMIDERVGDMLAMLVAIPDDDTGEQYVTVPAMAVRLVLDRLVEARVEIDRLNRIREVEKRDAEEIIARLNRKIDHMEIRITNLVEGMIDP